MSRVQCTDCGRAYPQTLRACPRCGSERAVVAKSEGKKRESTQHVRRGVLWMLMAGAIYWLASQDNISFPSPVTEYLLPLLFLGGLGLAIYGVVSWLR